MELKLFGHLVLAFCATAACSSFRGPTDGGAVDGSLDAGTDSANGDANGEAGICATVSGPMTVPYDDDDAKKGLRLHVTQNTTLTQFIFHNRGAANDVVYLIDGSCNGSVLQMIPVPPSTPSFTASGDVPSNVELLKS